MNREQMGPPAPKKYPPRRLQGRDPEERATLRDLWPVMLGQALDLLSTERMAGHVTRGGKVGTEMNPLPGMKSSLGRVGWSLAELLALHYATKDRPKLRKLVKDIRPGISGALAMNNFGIAQDQDVQEMVLQGMGTRR